MTKTQGEQRKAAALNIQTDKSFTQYMCTDDDVSELNIDMAMPDESICELEDSLDESKQVSKRSKSNEISLK